MDELKFDIPSPADDDLVLDYEDMIVTIMEKTGLDKSVVSSVLDAESDYMEQIGILMTSSSEW